MMLWLIFTHAAALAAGALLALLACALFVIQQCERELKSPGYGSD